MYLSSFPFSLSFPSLFTELILELKNLSLDLLLVYDHTANLKLHTTLLLLHHVNLRLDGEKNKQHKMRQLYTSSKKARNERERE